MKSRVKSKKGVSLVYVIMASAVLMVLSGALTASASHNIDLTTRSTESRQAYITAKSAMEYAKGAVNKQADDAKTSLNNDLTLSPEKLCNNFDASAPAGFKDFSVAPDGTQPSQFKQVFPSTVPNGTTVYGQCKITLPDRTKFVYHIAITVRVIYNSGFSKTLTFQADKDLTKGSTGSSGAPFLSFGGRYGDKSIVVKNDGQFDPIFETGNQEGILSGTGNLSSYDGNSAYPVILVDPVRTESAQPSCLKAPAVFFMATKYNGALADSKWLKQCSFYTDPGNGIAIAKVTLSSDFIYINGASIRGYRNSHSSYTDAQANQVILNSFSGAPRGVICFAKACSIVIADDCDGSNPRTVGSIPAGYYYFTNGMNLFAAGTLSTIAANRIANEDAVKNLYNVDYITNNCTTMYSTNNSNDARNTTLWAVDGKVQPAPSTSDTDQSKAKTGEDRDVYFYIERNNSNTPHDVSQFNHWVSNGAVYKANYISLMYPTNGDDADTANCPLICNNTSFQVKRGITLNSQKWDGAGDSNDKLVLRQDCLTSTFKLNSEDGSPVKVYLPHDLVLEKTDSTVIYTKSAGNYTVPSGTNIFSGDHFTAASGGSSWNGGDMG